MKKSLPAAFAALAVLAMACQAPKDVSYKSVLKDFTVTVPWGWSVMTDSVGDSFSQVNFIGPFDGDFFLGAPSLSIRWFKRYRPHALRDGRLEMYADADDFYKQMIDQVYGGKEAILYGGRRPDGSREILSKPMDIVLKASNLPAKFFIVNSPAPAPASNQWGVEVDKRTGKSVNMRMHAYALVQMEGGFYVLCYPATRLGYDKHEDRFRLLIGSFRPLTVGPGGAKVRLQVAAP